MNLRLEDFKVRFDFSTQMIIKQVPYPFLQCIRIKSHLDPILCCEGKCPVFVEEFPCMHIGTIVTHTGKTKQNMGVNVHYISPPMSGNLRSGPFLFCSYHFVFPQYSQWESSIYIESTIYNICLALKAASSEHLN